VFGCDLFGLLLTMPARRLGNASYGIYLLQGLVLAWMFAIAPVRAFALASAVQYWVVIFACALLLVLGASVAHHFIEQPGIRLGRRVTMLARDLARRVTINRGKGNSESMIGSADEMPR
jgi:peptidoglycan/LPS O-acetylase OafA/YrhL